MQGWSGRQSDTCLPGTNLHPSAAVSCRGGVGGRCDRWILLCRLLPEGQGGTGEMKSLEITSL